ncbi:MAG: hypothetical protein ABGX82_14820 [Pseudomonas sp.]|uniref:hypothetical protein n=1 Tax=Pseudomonas sp. TaxID=306 RepID=UPI003241FBE4
MNGDFVASEFFKGNDVLHCASLVITPNLTQRDRGLGFSTPTETISNGTITFVRCNDKAYGITCWHIIEIYREMESKYGESSHSMRTMLNGFYVVEDRFFRPSADFGQPQPDIAIRELNPAFLKKIGKVAIDLDFPQTQPEDLKYAIAVGFPSSLKYRRYEDGDSGYRVSMPHVQIVAELSNGQPNQRFSLFSQLDEVPSTLDYSGASGGPIFWSTKVGYGIIGIIYESASGSVIFGDKSIHVSGEMATPAIIKQWINEYHSKID